MELRRVEQDNLQAFRDLRLTALRDHPRAYVHSYEEECELPNRHAALLQSSFVIGVFDEGDLVAFTIMSIAHLRTQHKAQIWGAYVKPEFRNHGLGKQMRIRLFAIARHFGLIYCTSGIMADNAAALAMHHALGYQEMYREAKAIKFDDGSFQDVIHLVKWL